MANRTEERKKRFEETLSKMDTKYGSKDKGKDTTSLPTSQPTTTGSGGSLKETKQAQRQQKFESTLSKMESRYNKSASVDDTYINTFLQDAQSFLKRSASAVNGLTWSSATSGDRYNSWKNERSSMDEKAEKIRSVNSCGSPAMSSREYSKNTPPPVILMTKPHSVSRPALMPEEFLSARMDLALMSTPRMLAYSKCSFSAATRALAVVRLELKYFEKLKLIPSFRSDSTSIRPCL